MIRILLICAALWAGASASAAAESLSGVARVDPAQSFVSKDAAGWTEMRLQLTQGVPFRVFTLDDPVRLVLDFREVDWSGVEAGALAPVGAGLATVRFGVFQPGWSRLVADLDRPMLPQEVDMRVDDATGQATLRLLLSPVEPAVFTAASGVPRDVVWPETDGPSISAPVADDRFVVVIDPGHGGIDPGAERDGVSEKQLMLEFAFELREALMRRAGRDVDVVLTRDRDAFVALEARVALAHQAGGDLFLSLHADALSQGGAKGATVYLLSHEASDTASEHLAARHNRADILAGADLTGSDDEVTGVLLDLARQETEPRSEALAATLVETLQRSGAPMNSRPLRRAGFSVLKSADIPSVLVEVGFLSSERDLGNLRDSDWRHGIAATMAQAILDWRRTDEARRALVRQ